MKSLEKIIDHARASPHSVASLLMSAAIIATGMITATHGQLNVGIDELTTGLMIIPLTYKMLKYSKMRYDEFKQVIVKYERLEEEHVKSVMHNYFDRRAYRAAAYHHGYKDEFKDIHRKYKSEKHQKRYTVAQKA